MKSRAPWSGLLFMKPSVQLSWHWIRWIKVSKSFPCRMFLNSFWRMIQMIPVPGKSALCCASYAVIKLKHALSSYAVVAMSEERSTSSYIMSSLASIIGIVIGYSILTLRNRSPLVWFSRKNHSRDRAKDSMLTNAVEQSSKCEALCIWDRKSRYSVHIPKT